MRFILGIIGIAIGFLFVWKSEWILSNFGTVAWAEQHLGTEGGTRLFWKLMGILIIIISMLYMFGIIEGLIMAVFGKMFSGFAN